MSSFAEVSFRDITIFGNMNVFFGTFTTDIL